MSSVEHAVVAAAGVGARLGSDRPKCLTLLDDRPLIAHLLDRLKDIPDVRVVVGYREAEVMAAVHALRPDCTFVRNVDYRSTTTLESYYLGSQFLTEPCLYLDADIWFEPHSFQRFIEKCAASPGGLLGVTKAKSCDAVYVTRDRQGRVLGFDRGTPTEEEWANVAWLPPGLICRSSCAVFEVLSDHLPINGATVVAEEVDRPADLERARQAFNAWRASQAG